MTASLHSIDTADLKDRSEALGVRLNDQQLQQFERFSTLLSEWNEKLNLTAVPLAEYVERHYLDCLSITASPAWNPAGALIDVGTGAGFPGIPLKIAFPQLRVTLLESLQKRCVFLEEAVSDLGLKDIKVVNDRGELRAHSREMREQFDIACARAVASMAMLSEILLPYVRVGGAFIALKGTDIQQETEEALETVKVCGGKTPQLQAVQLPSSVRTLTVVTIAKEHTSPARVPRSYAAICKKPIKEHS